MRRRIGEDESIPWIGYTDFLSTLAIIFVVLFAVIAARSAFGPAVLDGQVIGVPTFDNCVVQFGDEQETTADSAGQFFFIIPKLAERTRLDVRGRCSGTLEVDTFAVMHPGDTTDLELRVKVGVSVQVQLDSLESVVDSLRRIIDGDPPCSKLGVKRPSVTAVTIVGPYQYRVDGNAISLSQLTDILRVDTETAANNNCRHDMDMRFVGSLPARVYQDSRAALAGLRFRTLPRGAVSE